MAESGRPCGRVCPGNFRGTVSRLHRKRNKIFFRKNVISRQLVYNKQPALVNVTKVNLNNLSDKNSQGRRDDASMNPDAPNVISLPDHSMSPKR